jgi:iron complex transport system permease protein
LRSLVISLMIGPAGLSPRAAPRRIILRRRPGRSRGARHPPAAHLLALLIGATLGLSGAALQGLLRNPLAEPALFGAPQAAAAASSFTIAFGFASRRRLRCRSPGIAGALFIDRRAGADRGTAREPRGDLARRLALASFAGAMTALILNLAPNPFIALESRSGCSARSKTAPSITC